MIDNPTRIKDLIKNLAKGDSGRAQLLQRRYVMERFLERVSVSEYKQNLVLKDGMLVASMLKIGTRPTRDTDVTMLDKTLDVESAKAMAEEIAAIPLGDGTTFAVKEAHKIMEDSEYGGVRISIEARFGKTRIPTKLDISTGDAITPSAVNYGYKLMLEDRTIDLLAYNVETFLAEKLETVIAHSTLNTRMRDFYDIWALSNSEYKIDYTMLSKAMMATATTRGHEITSESARSVMEALSSSLDMARIWSNYQAKNAFISSLSWNEVLKSTKAMCDKAILP